MAKKTVKSGTKNKSTDAKKQLERLPKAQLLEMHDLMVKARVLEERQIKIWWIFLLARWTG